MADRNKSNPIIIRNSDGTIRQVIYGTRENKEDKNIFSRMYKYISKPLYGDDQFSIIQSSKLTVPGSDESQRIISASINSKKSFDYGNITAINNDGTYQVTLSGRNYSYKSVSGNYKSTDKLKVDDVVLIGFIDGDKNKPIIIQPYLGSKVTPTVGSRATTLLEDLYFNFPSIASESEIYHYTPLNQLTSSGYFSWNPIQINDNYLIFCRLNGSNTEICKMLTDGSSLYILKTLEDINYPENTGIRFHPNENKFIGLGELEDEQLFCINSVTGEKKGYTICPAIYGWASFFYYPGYADNIESLDLLYDSMWESGKFSIHPEGKKMIVGCLNEVSYFGWDKYYKYAIFEMSIVGGNLVLLKDIESEYNGFSGLAYSKDGTKIIYSLWNWDTYPYNQIYIMASDGSTWTQLTFFSGSTDPKYVNSPVFSYDGNYLYFSSVDDVTYVPNIWKMNIDGTNIIQVTNNDNAYSDIYESQINTFKYDKIDTNIPIYFCTYEFPTLPTGYSPVDDNEIGNYKTLPDDASVSCNLTTEIKDENSIDLVYSSTEFYPENYFSGSALIINENDHVDESINITGYCDISSEMGIVPMRVKNYSEPFGISERIYKNSFSSIPEGEFKKEIYITPGFNLVCSITNSEIDRGDTFTVRINYTRLQAYVHPETSWISVSCSCYGTESLSVNAPGWGDTFDITYSHPPGWTLDSSYTAFIGSTIGDRPGNGYRGSSSFPQVNVVPASGYIDFTFKVNEKYPYRGFGRGSKENYGYWAKISWRSAYHTGPEPHYQVLNDFRQCFPIRIH